MKECLTLSVLLASLLGVGAVQADEGNFLVRVRAIGIFPEKSSEPGIGALAGVPADAITLSNKPAPEIDFTYFITQHWAAELILSYPQQHDVNLAGTGKIGVARHLPPTLTLQYHFRPEETVRPYLGAGINYTRFFNVDIVNGTFGLEHDSFGPAVQAGMDIRLAEKLYLNFDIKKIFMETDLKMNSTGAKVSHLNLNPVVVGVGFGWRF